MYFLEKEPGGGGRGVVDKEINTFYIYIYMIYEKSFHGKKERKKKINFWGLLELLKFFQIFFFSTSFCHSIETSRRLLRFIYVCIIVM